MTWHTSVGDRHLTGAEATLFQAALKETVEACETGRLDCSDTLLELESELSRLHLFALVGHYLLRPTPDLAPLNAWTEGAVGVIFNCMANSLDQELERESPVGRPTHYWRARIRAAANQGGWRDAFELPSDSGAIEYEPPAPPDWHQMIEFLEAQVLWDLSWAVDPITCDLSENTGSYFRWTYRSPLETHEPIALLRELCGYRRGESEGDDIV